MKATIYRPARNAMQSALGKTKDWVLEYENATARTPEPLMGWVSAGDTNGQVRIKFETLEEAVAFAQKKGLEYTVQIPHQRKIRPNNYAMNFRPDLTRPNP
jgi:hypothetical protein